MPRLSPFIVASSVLLMIVAVELLAILHMNNGVFVYALDDAYIHLSMAESIARYEYGINPGEFSSPSSSILWPFLLAPAAFFPFFEFFPLLMNIAASIGTLFISSLLLQLLFHRTEKQYFIILSFLVLLIPATGMAGLIFSGMEHSLQLFSVALLLYVMTAELREEGRTVLFIGALVFASAVRYENLSLVLFGIILLFIRRKFRPAAAAVACVGLVQLLFALFLFKNGSTLLPTSVLMKTGSLQSGFLSWAKISETVTSPFGGMYFLLAVFFFGYYYVRSGSSRYTPLALGAGFILLLHLMNGVTQTLGSFSDEFNYFFRYEMYVWYFSMMVLIVIGRNGVERLTTSMPAALLIVLIAAELFFCARNNSVLVSLPTASNNIYEQHYHNHRLVTEFYSGPVAVNDIGFVSFRNDEYVLDMWGLASRKLWLLRRANPLQPAWMDSVVSSNRIGLAILYESWFPILPSGWEKVGEMTLTRREVTASEYVVAYYATHQQYRDEIISALQSLQTVLPDRSMMMLFPAVRSVSAPTRDSIPEHR